MSLLLGSKRNRDSTWTRILLGCLVVGNLFSFPRASFVHGLIYRDPKDTAFFGHRPSCLPTICAAAAEVQGKSAALTARGAKIFDHRETSFHSSFFEEEDDDDEPERYNGRRCAIFFGSIQHRVRERKYNQESADDDDTDLRGRIKGRRNRVVGREKRGKFLLVCTASAKNLCTFGSCRSSSRRCCCCWGGCLKEKRRKNSRSLEGFPRGRSGKVKVKKE